jgi:hypothetical protein
MKWPAAQFRTLDHREIVVIARLIITAILLIVKLATEQGCCQVGKTPLACGCAEGDRPLPERKGSSHPLFLLPAKGEETTWQLPWKWDMGKPWVPAT